MSLLLSSFELTPKFVAMDRVDTCSLKQSLAHSHGFLGSKAQLVAQTA